MGWRDRLALVVCFSIRIITKAAVGNTFEVTGHESAVSGEMLSAEDILVIDFTDKVKNRGSFLGSENFFFGDRKPTKGLSDVRPLLREKDRHRSVLRFFEKLFRHENSRRCSDYLGGDPKTQCWSFTTVFNHRANPSSATFGNEDRASTVRTFRQDKRIKSDPGALIIPGHIYGGLERFLGKFILGLPIYLSLGDGTSGNIGGIFGSIRASHGGQKLEIANIPACETKGQKGCTGYGLNNLGSRLRTQEVYFKLFIVFFSALTFGLLSYFFLFRCLDKTSVEAMNPALFSFWFLLEHVVMYFCSKWVYSTL